EAEEGLRGLSRAERVPRRRSDETERPAAGPGRGRADERRTPRRRPGRRAPRVLQLRQGEAAVGVRQQETRQERPVNGVQDVHERSPTGRLPGPEGENSYGRTN